MLKRFFNKTIITVDIQPETIKLLKLFKTKRYLYVETAFVLELTKDIIKQHNVINWQECIAYLKYSLPKKFLRSHYFTLSLPAETVCMNTLKLPKNLPDNIIRQAIKDHVHTNSTTNTNELTMDYVVINNQVNMNTIIYAAIANDYIQDCTAALQSLPVGRIIIDIDIYALARLIAAQSQLNAFNVALIYVPPQVYFLLFSNTYIILHYRWHRQAMADFIVAIKDKLQLCENFIGEKINQLLICADREFVVPIVANLSDMITPKFITPYTNWLIKDKQSEQVIATMGQQFLIASGLALRSFT